MLFFMSIDQMFPQQLHPVGKRLVCKELQGTFLLF